MRGLQVERYTPPAGAVKVASARCEHLILGWKREQGGLTFDLRSLAIYCYLQGVTDAAQTRAFKATPSTDSEGGTGR